MSISCPLFLRRLILLLVISVFTGSVCYGFDIKKLLFDYLVKPNAPIIEVSWRDLVQYDYHRKIIPPKLQYIEGKLIRVPGYVVPLLGDFGGDFETLEEFLLVPVYGMCIHVPPPPPNQVI